MERRSGSESLERMRGCDKHPVASAGRKSLANYCGMICRWQKLQNMEKSLSRITVAVSGKISDSELVGLTRSVSLTQDFTRPGAGYTRRRYVHDRTSFCRDLVDIAITLWCIMMRLV